MENTQITDNKSRASLAKALAKVQGAVLAASKDGNNPFFSSKYATLAEILGVVREPLAQNGFALLQDADTDLEKNTVGVVTRLLHESGEEISSPRLSAPLKAEYTKAGTELPPSVQQIGAMVTYLRRYSVSAFLSVAVEDDDGNHATQIGKDAPASAPAKQPTAPTPPAGTRKSAYTGETIAPATPPPSKSATPPPGPPANKPLSEREKWAPGIESTALATAMARDKVNVASLTGYLNGTIGDPKIKSPILRGDMTLNSLGEKIVTSLLAPANWNMVVERLTNDEIHF